MAAGSLHEQLLQAMTAGRVASAVVVFLASSMVLDYWRKPSYPASIPRVGYGTGFVATLRNIAGFMLHYREWVHDGYVKVCICSVHFG